MTRTPRSRSCTAWSYAVLSGLPLRPTNAHVCAPCSSRRITSWSAKRSLMARTTSTAAGCFPASGAAECPVVPAGRPPLLGIENVAPVHDVPLRHDGGEGVGRHLAELGPLGEVQHHMGAPDV